MRDRHLALFTGCLFLALAVAVFVISPVRAVTGLQTLTQSPAPESSPTITCGIGTAEPCLEQGVTEAPALLVSAQGLQLSTQPAVSSAAGKAALYMFWGMAARIAPRRRPVLKN